MCWQVGKCRRQQLPLLADQATLLHGSRDEAVDDGMRIRLAKIDRIGVRGVGCGCRCIGWAFVVAVVFVRLVCGRVLRLCQTFGQTFVQDFGLSCRISGLAGFLLGFPTAVA